MSQETPQKLKHFADFMRIWKGQTLSAFGAQMSQFALGIWLFNQTGSVTLFGLVMIAQLLPAMALTPVVGIIVDKYCRRKLMMLCEMGLLATTGYLYFLASSNDLDPYWVLWISPLIAIFGVIHQLSYTASIGLLVTKPFYEKASALIQLGINTTAIVVPLISVMVLDFLGIQNVLLVNMACYLVSTYTLFASKFGYKSEASKPNKHEQKAGWWAQLLFGFTFVRDHPMLRSILFAACSVTFLQGTVHVLFRPMLLIENGNDVVGWVVTVAGIGGFIGALSAGALCQKYEKTTVIVSALAMCGLTMFICGINSNIWLIGFLALAFSTGIPLIIVASQALWISNVPSEQQGRVFSTNTFARGFAMLFAAGLSPVLSSHVFEPTFTNNKAALAEYGIEATALLPIQAVFFIVGILTMLSALLVWRSLQKQSLHTEGNKQSTENSSSENTKQSQDDAVHESALASDSSAFSKSKNAEGDASNQSESGSASNASSIV